MLPINTPELSISLEGTRPLTEEMPGFWRYLDARYSALRTVINEAVVRFDANPIDAIEWKAEGVVVAQTALTVLLDIEGRIRRMENPTPAAVLLHMERAIELWKGRVLSLARGTGSSTAAFTNTMATLQLRALADLVDPLGGTLETLKLYVERDVEESKKRYVRVHFSTLPQGTEFRLCPPDEGRSSVCIKVSARRFKRPNICEEMPISATEMVLVRRVPKPGETYLENGVVHTAQ